MLEHFYNYELFYLVPILILFLGASAVLVMGLSSLKSKTYTSAVSIVALLAAGVFSLSNFKFLKGNKILILSKSLSFDPFVFWMTLIILLGAAISTVLFHKAKAIDPKTHPNFMALMILSLIGTLTALMSENLLVLFIGAEVFSMSLCTMILLTRGSEEAPQSAFKYYILEAVSSSFFLLGLVFVYGSVSSQYGDSIFLSISDLREVSMRLMNIDHLFLIGSSLMMVSSALKIGFFPFHNWIPDVHQGAHTSLTYFFVTVAKITSFIVFIKLMEAGFLVEAGFLQASLQWAVVLSMVFGSLYAYQQKSFKRLVAYAGVAQSGFFMMGLLGFGYDGVGNIDSFVFYLYTYLFFTGLIMFSLVGLEDLKGYEVTLDDVKGLAQKKPIESILISIGALGLLGFPPLMGFLTKFYLVKTAFEAGFYWVVLWSIFASIVGAVYTLKILINIYFEDFDSKGQSLWENKLLNEKVETLSFKSFGLIVALWVPVFSIYFLPLNS